MLKSFNPRDYQLELYENAINQNTLIVLPTGLGKTAIAMLLSAKRVLLYPDEKIVFLAPTKPLVEQQMNAFKEKFMFDSSYFSLFTGSIPPEKRKQLYETSKFIFSTPQTIENDIISGNISFKDVSLIVFDEAHRATGNYSYVFLAENYMNNSLHPLILALSASPGSNKETIDEVCKNLFIENIEFKSNKNVDITKYVQKTEINWIEVELSKELKKIINYLNTSLDFKTNKLKEYGVLKNSNYGKLDLLKLQHQLHGEIAKGNTSLEILHSISLISEAIKLHHALELSETQTIFALNEYLKGIFVESQTTKVKSIKNLTKDLNFISAFASSRDLLDKNIEHPKITILENKIKSILEKNSNSKLIIFTQFRDTASQIKKYLDKFCTTKIFFGQSKKKGIGFSQKEQKQLLEDFSNEKFQVLIATSVAEEGLDIPSVDEVIFYEPIPSAIRSVQRRGRTGRHSKGIVTILMAKNTRDEIYRWTAYNKEKKMFKVLNELSNKSNSQLNTTQSKLINFENKEENENELVIYVDHREKNSSLVKQLLNEKINIKLKQLQVGDFLISSKVVVEFKNVRDFVDSIVDNRLLIQLKSLTQYEKPIIIVEGDEDIYSIRNVNHNAIDGMLATIVLDYRIPIFISKSPFHSAKLLISLAKREQINKEKSFTFHSAKPLTDDLLQEYIVSSFPNIGGILAKNILTKFDTLENFFNASKEDLISIPKLGEIKANEILKLRKLSYKQIKKQ
ncbi:MAG: DEAD/DEAH box helicase [Candidatus Woesearchaeota archaeon]